jgi:hypothetical protein
LAADTIALGAKAAEKHLDEITAAMRALAA